MSEVKCLISIFAILNSRKALDSGAQQGLNVAIPNTYDFLILARSRNEISSLWRRKRHLPSRTYEH